jgi:hypothetical protein
MGNGFCPLSCRQAHTYGMLVGVAANMKESSDDYRDFVFTVAEGVGNKRLWHSHWDITCVTSKGTVSMKIQ